MKLGILGAGALAQAFALRALAAGHEVVLSNSRGPETLRHVVAQLGDGAIAGTKFQAADHDTVLLAVHGAQVPVALSGLGDWDGRTLVDATNNLTAEFPSVPGILSSSEMVAELAKGAHVVKALNTLYANVLAADPRPFPDANRVIFISGDDIPSKTAFRGLLQQIGYFTVDLGDLAEGSRLQQFPGGPLAGLNLLKTP